MIAHRPAVSSAQDAVSPVRELLRMHGFDVARQALIEECNADFSLESMARCLRRRGLPARVIAFGATDLSRLGTTLVELKDRTIALLGIDGGSRYRLQLPDGSTAHTAREAGGLLAGYAIEVGTAWPPAGGFARRALRLAGEQPSVARAVALFGISLAVSGAFGYAVPAIARAIIDRAISEDATTTLAVLAAGIVLCGAFQALAGNLARQASLYVETRLSAAGSQGLMAHYLGLPFSTLQRHSAGDVWQTLSSVPVVVRTATQSVIAGAIDACLAMGYLVWLVALTGPLAAALIASYALLFGVNLAWAYRTARRKRQLLKASADQSDRLLELITRITTIRTESAEVWGIRRWERALRVEQNLAMRDETSAATLGELVLLVERIVVGATVLWAAYSSLSGARSLGEFFAAVAAAGGCTAALTRLNLLLSTALNAHALMSRVDDVLAENTAAATPSRSVGPRPDRGIEIERVWFRYDEQGPWIIEDFSLSIRPGEVQTICWPSGRGKTTLLRLVAGLCVPQRGSISVQGLEASVARHLVAYVPQGCPLFSGSIMHNLRLLSGDAPEDRLLAAIAASGLNVMLQDWPMGLDTIVAGGGANVSTGQRQLILLTAVVASQRPVLLLDEATTHLDPMLRVNLRVSSLLQDRTVVNVMHVAK